MVTSIALTDLIGPGLVLRSLDPILDRLAFDEELIVRCAFGLFSALVNFLGLPSGADDSDGLFSGIISNSR